MTLAATTNDSFRRIYIRRDNPIAKLIFAVREELGGDAGIIVGVVASERSLLRRNTGKTVFALKTAASYYKYYYMYPKVLSDEDSWELAFDSVVFDLEALDAKLSSGDEKQIIICDDIGLSILFCYYGVKVFKIEFTVNLTFNSFLLLP